MTFRTLLIAGASTALLTACAAPNEYNTYEVNKPASSYQTKTEESWKWSDMKFWGGEEDSMEEDMDMKEDMSEPMDITESN